MLARAPGHRATRCTTSRRRSRRSAATASATRRSGASSRTTATGWKSKIVIAGGTAGRHQLLQAGRRSRPTARCSEARLPLQRVPADRRGDQLQAAHAQDDGVLPRRPAELRGGRHAQPARVRPGLLRQERRRRGRRQADRAPVQDAGLRDGARTSACPRRSATPTPTTDTYSLRAGPGRVLLRAALRADGPGAVGAQPRRAGRRTGRGAGHRRGAGAARLRATSRPSAAPRTICTPRRCWSSRSRKCTPERRAARHGSRSNASPRRWMRPVSAAW